MGANTSTALCIECIRLIFLHFSSPHPSPLLLSAVLASTRSISPLWGLFLYVFGIWDTIKCNGTSCNKSDIDPHIWQYRYTYIYGLRAHMYIKNPSTRRTFLLLPLLSDLEPQCEERSNKDEQKQTKKNRQ